MDQEDTPVHMFIYICKLFTCLNNRGVNSQMEVSGNSDQEKPIFCIYHILSVQENFKLRALGNDPQKTQGPQFSGKETEKGAPCHSVPFCKIPQCLKAAHPTSCDSKILIKLDSNNLFDHYYVDYFNIKKMM